MTSDADARIDALEDEVAELRAQIQALTRELRALGVQVPDYEDNPGREPMSPEALRALREDLALQARAAKPVGKGKGKLSRAEKQKAVAELERRRKGRQNS